MKTDYAVALLVVAVLSAACQGATPTPPPTPAGQVETSVAATIAAGQTATAVIEQAVKLTLTAAVPSPTHTLPPSPTPEPTTAVPPTDTPVPTATPAATKKPAPAPTSTPMPPAAPFTGTWQGPDPVDGSTTTLSLVQTENNLAGTFSDTYSPNIQPPGYQGSGTGTVLSATTAQMTFNLTRWDGKTAQADFHLTLSNQNNTLTLDCVSGCPIVLQRR